ncbi:MAG: AmmeMemoRadiSam system protein B, partial [Hyphomicrobiales bacterium]
MSTQTVRPPAVAGLFYPGEPSALAGQIGRLLENVEDLIAAPKALIVPHAGYIYSGPVAASAMAQLRPHRG